MYGLRASGCGGDVFLAGVGVGRSWAGGGDAGSGAGFVGDSWWVVAGAVSDGGAVRAPQLVSSASVVKAARQASPDDLVARASLCGGRDWLSDWVVAIGRGCLWLSQLRGWQMDRGG